MLFGVECTALMQLCCYSPRGPTPPVRSSRFGASGHLPFHLLFLDAVHLSMRIPKKRRFALAKPTVSASKQQALKSAIRRRVVLERIRLQNERERTRREHERETSGDSGRTEKNGTSKGGGSGGKGSVDEDPEPVTEEDLANFEGEKRKASFRLDPVLAPPAFKLIAHSFAIQTNSKR